MINHHLHPKDQWTLIILGYYIDILDKANQIFMKGCGYITCVSVSRFSVGEGESATSPFQVILSELDEEVGVVTICCTSDDVPVSDGGLTNRPLLHSGISRRSVSASG